MANVATQADFAAFQAWQAQQAAALTADEAPKVTIAEVLCALVRSGRWPTENTVHQFCQVITDHFAPPAEESAEVLAEAGTPADPFYAPAAA